MITEQLVKLFDKEISSFRIQFPHPFNVAQEKPLSDESCQRCLVDRGRVLIHRTPNFSHRIDQLLRHNDIAETQGGIKNFTHRPRVNHTTGVVQSLQAWQRWPSKTKLCVVVAFENKRVVLTRNIE